MAVADSVFGPWQRRDESILEPRPGRWDALQTTDPTVCVHDDGSVVMVYKSVADQHGPLRLGVAGADRFDGPYHRLSDDRLHQFDDVEDPFIWFEDGVYQLIVKDMTGRIAGEPRAGIHATSNDAVTWRVSDPPLAWSRRVLWDDGVVREQGAFERPQLLIENGRPTHLFAATGEDVAVDELRCYTMSRSWNMVIPLR